jgi:hypothetical protein
MSIKVTIASSTIAMSLFRQQQPIYTVYDRRTHLCVVQIKLFWVTNEWEAQFILYVVAQYIVACTIVAELRCLDKRRIDRNINKLIVQFVYRELFSKYNSCGLSIELFVVIFHGTVDSLYQITTSSLKSSFYNLYDRNRLQKCPVHASFLLYTCFKCSRFFLKYGMSNLKQEYTCASYSISNYVGKPTAAGCVALLTSSLFLQYIVRVY